MHKSNPSVMFPAVTEAEAVTQSYPTRQFSNASPRHSPSMSDPIIQPSFYPLPSSPSLLVDDRFSILDLNINDPVPFWTLFTAVITQETTTPSSLIDILETIAVTLRGSAGTDYGFLRSFLTQELSAGFWTEIWPFLRGLALRMPELFPEHRLPVLDAANPRLVLSREQVACLVVHQFLGTLPRRDWEEGEIGYQDFHIWYASEQPHAGAVQAYLKALFVYFERIAGKDETTPVCYTIDEWPVVYELVTDDEGLHGNGALTAMDVLRLEDASTAPDVLGLPDGAAVISANKFIGFGRTGTQEETHVGASPEACASVLVTPPLREGQVAIVTGAEAMVSILGYGRTARCGEILKAAGDRSKHRETWVARTMLFMDALELDLADQSLGKPVDLQPGNVLRDLRKAYIAFRHKRRSSSSNALPSIYTGFWGCRTFGGNPEIKACIQWCAAALAGCNITFICSGEEQQVFADKLERFIGDIQQTGVRADVLKEVLLDMQPSDVVPDQGPFVAILARLRTSHV